MAAKNAESLNLITDVYLRLNKALHEDIKKKFGIGGHKWAKYIMALGFQDVLDYGCGKCSLDIALPFDITNYDPCIPGKDAMPDPHDVVVCTDVMEHIEPEFVDNVLDHIKSLARYKVFFAIDTIRADHLKTLPDGSTCHPSVHSHLWWMPKLQERWVMKNFGWNQWEFYFTGVPFQIELPTSY